MPLFILTGFTSPAKILYPTPDTHQLHFQFTHENIIKHDKVINLCLIQSYHTDRTVAKGIIKQGNTTFETNTSFRLMSLKSGLSASAVLRRKVLRTQNRQTGLVYFIKIQNISQNANKQLENLQGTVRFICSVNGPKQPATRVSFKLNLTDKQIDGKTCLSNHHI